MASPRHPAARLPPLVVTLLAPAERCNQGCPACILDRLGEPVRDFVLEPSDYGELVHQLASAGVPVAVISFQGFEVTLPHSWPYVEHAFRAADAHNIRRSFITNGMLLRKWTDRIESLDPQRIAVSLDGSDAEVNDRLRGLSGAFRATTRSIREFLKELPHFGSRLSVVSTLYGEANFLSLRRMPALLQGLGISRWALGFEIEMRDGVEQPVRTKPELERWLSDLVRIGRGEGLQVYVNDEFALFGTHPSKTRSVLQAKRVFAPEFLIRVEPTGHVRVGREALAVWDETTARRWNPRADSIVDVIEYEKRVARYRERRE